MDDISTEFEQKADELRSLAFQQDITQAEKAIEVFIEDADAEEFIGVCYYIGIAIYSYVEMNPQAGFLEFRVGASEETSLPMAFYLNTFLNSLIWQNPQLAIATVETIATHTKRTRMFFLWKLLVISQALSDLMETSLTEDM